jgi:predicted Zn-dependent protease
MIATTKRGMLITRFNNLELADPMSMTMTGNTRDGVWLIENGKISKAVKNFRVYDSPMFALNNVEQVSEPQRTFRPEAPAVCPAIKVREFNLSGLMDAV